MPAIEEPTLFERIRLTSMSQLLRGKLSDGETPARVIESSGLDTSTRQLILHICAKSRLWTSERLDVARELVAHFLDAKEAGIKSDNAIRAFGDPDSAAKLIRASKIRGRSTAWHALRFLRRAAGVIVLLYLGLAIYFFLGKPRVSVDYVAKINASVPHVAEADRAWTFYLKLDKAFASDLTLKDKKLDLDPRAGDKRWPSVREWVRGHPEMLALADEATARPAMGFVYGENGSADEMQSLPKNKTDTNDPFYNSVIAVLLPYLNTMRQTSNMLAADARIAAEEGDSARWLRRVQQMDVIARQANEPRFLINSLVGIQILSQRLELIDRVLWTKPQLLTDPQLVELAHTLTRYHKPSDLMTYEAERYAFLDIVQRLYTDNGHGDGHFTTRGITDLNKLLATSRTQPGDFGKGALAFAMGPVNVIMPSRKELLEKYDQLMTKQEMRIDVPWRNRETVTLGAELEAIRNSPIQSLRYALIAVLLPALDRAPTTAERFLTVRDAIQVGIALELYRREHGNYPATMDALIPTLLPAAPIDPVDGKPVRYKLVDGKPMVYSIGIDERDDGGQAATVVAPGRSRPAGNGDVMIGSSRNDVRGDWILYPQPPMIDSEPDEEELPTTEPTSQPEI